MAPDRAGYDHRDISFGVRKHGLRCLAQATCGLKAATQATGTTAETLTKLPIVARPWLVIHVHYIYPDKARAKADAVGISTPTYWQQVNCAHSYLAGPIDDVEEPTRRDSA
jgi:hypothetical protein